MQVYNIIMKLLCLFRTVHHQKLTVSTSGATSVDSLVLVVYKWTLMLVWMRDIFQ